MTCKHRINLPARCAISVNVSPMSQIGEVSFMLSEQLNITQTKERLEFTLFRLPSKPLDGNVKHLLVMPSVVYSTPLSWSMNIFFSRNRKPKPDPNWTENILLWLLPLWWGKRGLSPLLPTGVLVDPARFDEAVPGVHKGPIRSGKCYIHSLATMSDIYPNI